MKLNRREEIQTISQTGSFGHQAYMSSALTNLEPDQRRELEGLLEDLFYKTFLPLKIRLYLPHVWSSPDHNVELTPEEVYILDRFRIAQSDFLVVCANHPSFGVGQEIEIAQNLGLRSVVFAKKGTRISRMLAGGPSLYGTATVFGSQSPPIIWYEEKDDLLDTLWSRITSLIDTPPEGITEIPAGFAANLKQAMMTHKPKPISLEELAKRTGFTLAFVRFLLSDRTLIDKMLRKTKLPELRALETVSRYTNPGLWVLARLSTALDRTLPEMLGESLVASSQVQVGEVRRRRQNVAWEVAVQRNVRIQDFLKLRDSMEELEAAHSYDAERLRQECEERLDSITGSSQGNQGKLF